MKSSVTSNKPPKALSKEAAAWWTRILKEFDLDDCGLLLLENALTGFDRMRQAQDVIEREGVITIDRFRQQKTHPATLIERDAKTTMLNNLRALGLDVVPTRDGPGRPPRG